MARRKDPVIPDAILDQLLAGADAKTVFERNGLLDQLKKALTERALKAELGHHLAGDEGANPSQRLRLEDGAERGWGDGPAHSTRPDGNVGVALEKWRAFGFRLCNGARKRMGFCSRAPNVATQDYRTCLEVLQRDTLIFDRSPKSLR